MSFHKHIHYAGMPRLWRRDKRKHDQLELEDVPPDADLDPTASPSNSRRASRSLSSDEPHDAELDLTSSPSSTNRASCIPSLHVPYNIELDPTTSPSNAETASCIPNSDVPHNVELDTTTSQSNARGSIENAPFDESPACVAQASCATDRDSMSPGSLVQVVPLIPPGPDGKAIKDRLKAEGVSETELGDLLPAAINNYAHFYAKRRSEVNLHKVVFTSAGLRGWASADLGYAEKVLTVHFTGEDANGDTEIACTSPGGITTKLTIQKDTTVAMVRTSLADRFDIQSDLLQLVLPDSRLLTGSEDDAPILQSRAVSHAPVSVPQDSDLSRWQPMLWQSSRARAGLDIVGKQLGALVPEQCFVSSIPRLTLLPRVGI